MAPHLGGRQVTAGLGHRQFVGWNDTSNYTRKHTHVKPDLKGAAILTMKAEIAPYDASGPETKPDWPRMAHFARRSTLLAYKTGHIENCCKRRALETKEHHEINPDRPSPCPPQRHLVHNRASQHMEVSLCVFKITEQTTPASLPRSSCFTRHRQEAEKA